MQNESNEHMMKDKKNTFIIECTGKCISKLGSLICVCFPPAHKVCLYVYGRLKLFTVGGISDFTFLTTAEFKETACWSFRLKCWA